VFELRMEMLATAGQYGTGPFEFLATIEFTQNSTWDSARVAGLLATNGFMFAGVYPVKYEGK
ncbi:MAG: hypothetical protein FWE95_07780, partial [Planctomycetaceae bacterium]|nr:hypothetical protein [Planctomycetaceae bacterium]